jgi:pyruvate, orthophosphate dikinase
MSSVVQGLGEGPGSLAQLGELGAGLVDLMRLGLRVPDGFVVTAEAQREAAAAGQMPAAVWEQVVEALLDLRERAGAERGDGIPALVVRPSAPPGMRGALPSFAGIGISGETAAGASRDDAAFGEVLWSARAALLRRWAYSVHGLAEGELPATGEQGPAAEAGALESFLAARDAAPPEEPIDQLKQAIATIWRAWDGGAVAARRRDLRGVPAAAGTAVVVQLFVLGRDALRGTVFTREPETGSPEPVGYLLDGPSDREGRKRRVRLSAMRRRLGRELYRELSTSIPLLEAGWRDLCEIDFVIDGGSLWFAGVRKARRSSGTAVRVAVDMAHEGLIGKDEALLRVPLSALLELQTPIAPRGNAAEGDSSRLVPAQPDMHTSQLLDWCDERRWLRIAQSAPRGWTLVSSAAEISHARATRLLLDLDGLLQDEAPLGESLSAATSAGAEELGIQLADMPAGGDLTLPPGPWTLVVGSPARSWAARLLGARPTHAAALAREPGMEPA